MECATWCTVLRISCGSFLKEEAGFQKFTQLNAIFVWDAIMVLWHWFSTTKNLDQMRNLKICKYLKPQRRQLHRVILFITSYFPFIFSYFHFIFPKIMWCGLSLNKKPIFMYTKSYGGPRYITYGGWEGSRRVLP